MSKITVLSPQEAQLHAMADEVIAKLRAACETANTSLLQTGALLRVVVEHELWRLKGYESFEAFIDDPENNRGLSRRHLFRTLRTARTYLPQPGQAPPVPLDAVAKIGIIKADLIAPLIPSATPEQRAELVARAETLTVQDLTRSLRTDRRAMESPAMQEADRRQRLAARLHGLADNLIAADDIRPVLASIIRVCTEAAERVA